MTAQPDTLPQRPAQTPAARVRVSEDVDLARYDDGTASVILYEDAADGAYDGYPSRPLTADQLDALAKSAARMARELRGCRTL